eukprot:TRINITY_DN23557_c0_g1_i1.p1 TRINITY_DN23557_c0_g1~~TRINITY_DN23557_c0_g1_i1.p1  ORF type:complete len:336 (-),score=84.95 TRINITY_DN23557_c0_g1_i1:335-1315(-)
MFSSYTLRRCCELSKRVRCRFSTSIRTADVHHLQESWRQELNNLPGDIVLVRHGESEGNLAQRQSRKGDDRFWTDEFGRRHTSDYRLTDRGRHQALATGEYMRKNCTDRFDAYFVSEYVRAQETAALLGLPNARWSTEFYLAERDKGVLGGLSYSKRKSERADVLKMLARDPFFVAPPGGESMSNVCLRVDRMLDLWRKLDNKSVVAVCHGNLMMAFRVRLEKMHQDRFTELEESHSPLDKIHHGHILHYTRRNPETGEMQPVPGWVRSICPWDTSRSTNDWQRIERSTFSNEELLRLVNKTPQLVNEPYKPSVDTRTSASRDDSS